MSGADAYMLMSKSPFLRGEFWLQEPNSTLEGTLLTSSATPICLHSSISTCSISSRILSPVVVVILRLARTPFLTRMPSAPGIQPARSRSCLALAGL